MLLTLIAAMGKNRAIGYQGKMPWHLPADFAYFKKMTKNYPMIMGRATWDSLPGVLPGRRHLVITRQKEWSQPGCDVFHSIDEALLALSGESNVMVIGGSQLYEQTLSRADRILLTEIQAEFAGDRFFPALDREIWFETSRFSHKADDKNCYDYDFVTYEKNQ